MPALSAARLVLDFMCISSGFLAGTGAFSSTGLVLVLARAAGAGTGVNVGVTAICGAASVNAKTGLTVLPLAAFG